VGTLVAGSGIALLLISDIWRFQVGLFHLLDRQIASRLQEVREILAKTALSTASWDALEHFLVQSYPSLLFLSILFGAVVNYYLARYIRGLGNPEARKKDLPFSSWSLPEYWIWGLILSLLLYLLPEPYRRAGLNLLLVFLGLYLLQGAAVSSSLFRRWQLPTALKVFLYLLSFSQPFLLLLLALIGLSDVWLNFRKMADPISSDGG
jgi:uncharacterized protein YybS (DUF2232 family)